MFIVTLLGFIVTPVIGLPFTVMKQVAVLPFDVVTVMVAVPGLTAVTNPLEDTFATYILLELQLNALLSVVSLGTMAAVSCRDSPIFIDTLVGFNVTPVIELPVTVTAQVAVLPFDVLTVMVAVPGLLAVTYPLAVTDATPELFEVQVSALLSVVLLGEIVAVSCNEMPGVSDALAVFNDTPVIGTETL